MGWWVGILYAPLGWLSGTDPGSAVVLGPGGCSHMVLLAVRYQVTLVLLWQVAQSCSLAVPVPENKILLIASLLLTGA